MTDEATGSPDDCLHHKIVYEVVYRTLEADGMARQDLVGVEVVLSCGEGEAVVILSGADNAGRLDVNLLLTRREAHILGRALLDAGFLAA